MTVYTFFLDAILIFIVLISVCVSVKQGFVRVLVEVAGLTAALFITLTFCTPLAELTYDKIIEPPIIASTSDKVYTSFDDAVDSVWETVPDFIRNYAEKSGLTATGQFDDEVLKENTEQIAVDISKKIIRPLATEIFSAVYSIIILIVLMFVVKLLARILNKMFSFSILGKLNGFLGGVFGLLKGICFAFLFCVVVYVLISFTKNGIWIFNFENINKTYIFKFLIDLIKI